MGNYLRTYSFSHIMEKLGQEKKVIDWKPEGFKSKQFSLKVIKLSEKLIVVVTEHQPTQDKISKGQAFLLRPGRSLNFSGREIVGVTKGEYTRV